MRLLNTKSLLLESFEGKPVPPYAILSHTWEDDEVLYEDVFSGQSSQVMPTDKQGYTKIKYSCDQAQYDGLEYIWIDTCCINKTSSAELSEAINSMFNWYERASRCYVYLFDLNRPNHPDISFEDSRWFNRGWTLQELIAPLHVEFYDNQWMPLGDKGTGSRDRIYTDEVDGSEGFEAILNLECPQPENYEGNLAYRIESITGIPIEVLTLRKRPISRLLSRFPAAQRLSWAANRHTSRPEDRAYSLLGLFDINMPLLYGEGKEAFLRLQQQIMNRYNDQTLLAFTSQEHAFWESHSPLAKDPTAFANSDIIRVPKSQRSAPEALGQPFSYSWRHIDVQIYLCTSLSHGQKYALGILDCGYSDNPLSRPALLLRRLDGAGHCYRRILHSYLCKIHPRHLLNSELIRLDLPWLPLRMWNHFHHASRRELPCVHQSSHSTLET